MHQSYLHKSQQITEFSIKALNICSHFVEGRDTLRFAIVWMGESFPFLIATITLRSKTIFKI